MLEISKKLWKKPELTVLVRNTPEESVLSYCKNNLTVGENGFFDNCALIDKLEDCGGGFCSCPCACYGETAS